MKDQNITDELVETYILHNDFEHKAGEMYECPGGHIWHWSDIVDTIENMTPPELYNLCFLAEQDDKNMNDEINKLELNANDYNEARDYNKSKLFLIMPIRQDDNQPNRRFGIVNIISRYTLNNLLFSLDMSTNLLHDYLYNS